MGREFVFAMEREFAPDEILVIARREKAVSIKGFPVRMQVRAVSRESKKSSRIHTNRTPVADGFFFGCIFADKKVFAKMKLFAMLWDIIGEMHFKREVREA